MKKLSLSLFFFITSGLSGLQAVNHGLPDVEKLIASKLEPEGVVFEITTWEDNSWRWAAPLLSSHTQTLREQYPNLEIVLISQGNELFDLTLKNNIRMSSEIGILKKLSKDNFDIYVAGDFAKYKRLGSKDFLPFVFVSPSGAAQLEDYISLGFTHIILEQPNVAD